MSDIAFFPAVIIGYTALMFAISLWARTRIETAEDFLVAGRRLPLMLAWPTLFATWFGAGTLLTQTDEVHASGLFRAALDPLGAGICLLLAGMFLATRLWKMELLTLGDFYARRFGRRAELAASIMMVPGYCGWIAAQFTALAAVLELFLGIDAVYGIALVCAVGTAYTLIGGMWSVTLTDAVQTGLLLLGLAVLAWNTASTLGGGDVALGWSTFVDGTPPELLAWFGAGDTEAVVLWIGMIAAGALGNLPGQDLMQRIFASKSATVARRACYIAGTIYLVAGFVPLAIGLSAHQLFDASPESAVLAFVAEQLLNPILAAIFLLAILSAVLSTIDSAILSPASVLAQNILPRLFGDRYTTMQLSQASIVAVAAVSLIFAYVGESAFSLLEAAYEIGLVALLVPLVFGLYSQRGRESAALASIIVGTGVWFIHLVAGWETFFGPLLEDTPFILPTGPMSALLAIVAYLAATPRGELRPVT